MAEKKVVMDSNYREKHYPKGFYAAMVKNTRGGGIALIICGLLLALIGGAILFVLAAMAFSGEDLSAALGENIFFGIVGLVFFLPGLLLIWSGIKRCRSNAEDWIRETGEASGCSESTVRDFAGQALEDGTLVMFLGTTRNQCFLTRDYVWMGNLSRIEDIEEGYLVETSYTANVNGKRVRMYSKNIRLLTKNGKELIAEAKEDEVNEILDLLTDKNPSIDTDGRRMLSESEYSKRKELLQKSRKG